MLTAQHCQAARSSGWAAGGFPAVLPYGELRPLQGFESQGQTPVISTVAYQPKYNFSLSDFTIF